MAAFRPRQFDQRCEAVTKHRKTIRVARLITRFPLSRTESSPWNRKWSTRIWIEGPRYPTVDRVSVCKPMLLLDHLGGELTSKANLSVVAPNGFVGHDGMFRTARLAHRGTRSPRTRRDR
jgi:hypothetical protein